jgi:hypothetical protein
LGLRGTSDREWRRLHNEELYDLYCYLNVIGVIKLSRMRWTGHVASVGGWRGAYRVWWGDLRKRDHLEDPVIDGSIMLKFIFKIWDGGMD